MRYAVSIPPFNPPADVVRLAKDAEAAGWDGVFVWDHLRWSNTHNPDVHDPWVLLGAIAQATEAVRLGTLVTPLPRRRPWVVAKHIVTLDHLSEGRAVLGVGIGAPDAEDFADFGDEGSARGRGALLDEGLDILAALLEGRQIDHHTDHYDVSTRLSPAAIQRPRPPIWVAAVVPHRKPLARARRWDGVAPIGSRGPLHPDALADYLSNDRHRPGWDVVAPWAPGVPADEYAAVGATWLTVSAWPQEQGWFEMLSDQVRRGPVPPT